jgi:hypothetical protein
MSTKNGYKNPSRKINRRSQWVLTKGAISLRVRETGAALELASPPLFRQ